MMVGHGRRVLVTGAAGFIGYHVARALLDRDFEVSGVDNLNAYYPVSLKEDRLAQLATSPAFSFQRLDLSDRAAVAAFFRDVCPPRVIHLAAQAGVRYSLENPAAYVDSNLTGFANVLEGCRAERVAHLVFASSSSVYGNSARQPLSEHDGVDHPISLYAATKKANELMAHTYAHLFGIPCTGLRFFTVYGPWGRPDMAYFSFTRAIMEGRPLPLFEGGQLERDFTYVDDVVEGIIRVLDRPAAPDPQWDPAHPDPASSSAPYRIYNIGNHQPVRVTRMVELLEKLTGQRARIENLPRQPGDVFRTEADVSDLAAAVGFAPYTPLEEGLSRFVDWYRAYYK